MPEELLGEDCIHANITVMGQTMEARFRMNCAAEPCQLDIEVLPKGTSCSSSATINFQILIF